MLQNDRLSHRQGVCRAKGAVGLSDGETVLIQRGDIVIKTRIRGKVRKLVMIGLDPGEIAVLAASAGVVSNSPRARRRAYVRFFQRELLSSITMCSGADMQVLCHTVLYIGVQIFIYQGQGGLGVQIDIRGVPLTGQGGES